MAGGLKAEGEGGANSKSVVFSTSLLLRTQAHFMEPVSKFPPPVQPANPSEWEAPARPAQPSHLVMLNHSPGQANPDIAEACLYPK